MKRIHYLLLGSLMMFLAACEKDTLPTHFAPSVTTGNATDIYRKGAVLSGSIQLGSTATAKSYGILFSELESMAEYTEYAVTDGRKEFNISLSTLNPGTTYYFSAYANSGYTMKKGQMKSFTTPASNAPIFAEVIISNVDIFTCQVSTSLQDDGGSNISLCGFCWSKVGEGEPDTNGNIQNAAIENGGLFATITGLEADTEYLIRAYAINSDGVGYSETINVRTEKAQIPTLSDIIQKESSDFSVTIEAQVTDIGTSAVTEVGFCWSTSNPMPTMEDSYNDTTNQQTEENNMFSMTLSDLIPNSTYYIRAYAINDEGISYSKVFTFKTAEKNAENGTIQIPDLPINNWK